MPTHKFIIKNLESSRFNLPILKLELQTSGVPFEQQVRSASKPCALAKVRHIQTSHLKF